MSFLNRSRPTSGIVALIGASVGLLTGGAFVYTEVQKVKSATPRVFECMNEGYQLSNEQKELASPEHVLAPTRISIELKPGFESFFQAGGVIRGLYANHISMKDSLDQRLKSFEKRQAEYQENCPPSITGTYATHSAAADYWACATFVSLAAAGIALTINRSRRREPPFIHHGWP